MILNRVFRASSCSSCRLSVLRQFSSAAGPSRLSHASNLSSHSIQRQPQRLRSFSSQENHEQDVFRDEGKSTVEEEIESIEDRNDLADAEAETEHQATEVTSVPWYLQVKSPPKTPKPLSERQRIPELPDSPPPILHPLLQQVSIDLGLDNLTLLDLRKLDPPPALGANLLMLLGTARSEKHLHVSADRLCRWLRSTYKLRPDADGLLGRNELKLKLRRKAKRAKLMGSVDENADDGVRTGWVCVDVGIVDSAEGEKDVVDERDSFVGFGRKTDGVRLVVQMLTEEKRQEMELERLWSGILKRSSQDGMMIADEIAIDPESHTQSEPNVSWPEPAPNGGLHVPSGTRGFQTFSR